jgi:hypothetical protein
MPSVNHLDEYSERVANVDLRHGVGAAVLVEEAEVRDERARQRQEDAKV